LPPAPRERWSFVFDTVTLEFTIKSPLTYDKLKQRIQI